MLYDEGDHLPGGRFSMLTAEEFDKLATLLKHLHICMGLKFALMDDQAREIFTSSTQTDFCAAVKSAAGGLERCLGCDAAALREVTATQKMKKYRCHCGLIEAALPVVENGQVIAFILLGQFLDEAPREKQWRRSLSLLDWYPDGEGLSECYSRLRQVSSEELSSLIEIVHACIAEVRLQGMLSAAQMSDGRRLTEYIAQHYSRPITLDELCSHLHMGRSKLFELCRREFEKTPGELILEARISAARELLQNPKLTTAEIAQAVGYPDASYFCQRFRRVCGQTPSEYRRECREA